MSLPKTELPIWQAPMAGAQAGALAAAVSEAGGMGGLPCALLTADSMRKEIELIRGRTQNPFNVNFFAHTAPAPDANREASWRKALAPYYREFGIDEAKIPAG